jgi:hypothetical protein
VFTGGNSENRASEFALLFLSNVPTERISMKKIKVRKAGAVRLTSAATLYDRGCAAN